MSLLATRARLVALTQDLELRWSETRHSWPDAKGLEFQKQYLEELFAAVNRSTAVIESLEKLLNKVRTDCE